MCCANFGGFCRGFSWRIFLGTLPTKMRRKNPATKPATKSGGLKKAKSAKNPLCPKTRPKILRDIWREFCGIFFRPTKQRPKNFGNISGHSLHKKIRSSKKNIVRARRSAGSSAVDCIATGERHCFQHSSWHQEGFFFLRATKCFMRKMLRNCPEGAFPLGSFEAIFRI